MDIITGSLMQELDKKTQDSISSSILMDNAGNKMFNIILKYYPNTKNVLILAGSGGNAGDGFVIARLMEEININVAIYLSSDIKNETSKEKFLMLKNVSLVKSLDDLEKYDLIIDALFGIGLKRDLNNEYKSIISIANESMVDIVSLDIPSGIDSTSGISYGAFIKSKLLITVEYAKTGLFLNDGIDSFDKLEIIDVGICHTKDTIHLIQKEDFLSYYTKRLRNTNKGSFGKSSIIAGSVKYPGASLLSYQALASFKMGVGFQNLYLIPSLYNLYSLQHPEIITNKLDEIDGHIKYNEELLDNIIKHSDSISIGMGMEVSQDLYDTIKYLLIN